MREWDSRVVVVYFLSPRNLTKHLNTVAIFNRIWNTFIGILQGEGVKWWVNTE
jgi:hypothetical protein